MSATANCLECDAPVPVPQDAIKGEIVTCKECGTAFELALAGSDGAFTLLLAEQEEEDWGE